MSNPKKRVGRGIASIFSADTKRMYDEINNPNLKLSGNSIQIELSKIKSNPHQPRQFFDEGKLNELVESIKNDGLIQPIVVNRKNIIIAGERRFRAARKLGWKRIQALICDADEKKMATIALAENVIREDINPIEEAEAYQRLVKEFGYRQEDVAKQFGKSRAVITNSIRLLKLPSYVRHLLINKKISAGHGRMLLQYKNDQEIIRQAKRIIEEKIPVNLVKTKQKPKLPSSKKEKKKVIQLDKYQGTGIIEEKKIILRFKNSSNKNRFINNVLYSIIKK